MRARTHALRLTCRCAVLSCPCSLSSSSAKKKRTLRPLQTTCPLPHRRKPQHRCQQLHQHPHHRRLCTLSLLRVPSLFAHATTMPCSRLIVPLQHWTWLQCPALDTPCKALPSSWHARTCTRAQRNACVHLYPPTHTHQSPCMPTNHQATVWQRSPHPLCSHALGNLLGFVCWVRVPVCVALRQAAAPTRTIAPPTSSTSSALDAQMRQAAEAAFAAKYPTGLFA